MSNTIIRIEQVHNPELEKRFTHRSSQLTCHNIQYLFHGSSNKAYDKILETGFDLTYASPSGLLGKGFISLKMPVIHTHMDESLELKRGKSITFCIVRSIWARPVTVILESPKPRRDLMRFIVTIKHMRSIIIFKGFQRILSIIGSIMVQNHLHDSSRFPRNQNLRQYLYRSICGFH